MHNLKRLFQPKSIAVIGGGDWCNNVIRQSLEFGFTGPIWPVHPSKPKIAGLHTYRSVSDLPDTPDAAFIGINRDATIAVVADLAKRKTGGAVCFANGFLEAQGQDETGGERQQQLLAAAANMPLLGPNCYGFINYLDGALLWPDQQGGVKTDRGVAIITQSSNIAINITMQRRALPIAYIITAGNQAQVGLAEIGATLLSDPRVSCLGLHIEGINDIKAFETLRDLALAKGKTIVALRTGRSQKARAAALSHTASLAGSDAGARALLTRLEIPQVGTLPEFLESLKLLHVAGPLKSNRLVSMSCSGGEASLIADMIDGKDLQFPTLNTTQMAKLGTTLGPRVSLGNPLDYNTYIWNDASSMIETFTAMMGPTIDLGLVIADFPRADRCDPKDWDCVADAVIQTSAQTAAPMAIVATLAENMPEDRAAQLIDQNVTPLCGIHEALTAIRVAVECGKTLAKSAPVLLPKPPANPTLLDEAKAKTDLTVFGLIPPTGRAATHIDQLRRFCDDLTFPLVLKALGHAHKTEAGMVALNLASPDQVTIAAKTMPPGPFLLEEMVQDVVAELLIGVVLDPAHGYVLTLGAGGILSELLQDTASLLIPTTGPEIETALKGLKIFPLLQGYRGKNPADLPAIVNAVLSLQSYVIANHGRIEEVEVNPLLALRSGAIAADALIRIGDIDERLAD